MKKDRGFKTSELVFTQSWPRLSEIGDEVVVIFDKVLLRRSPSFKKWIKAVPLQYPVQAGEALKDIQNFPKHIKKSRP